MCCACGAAGAIFAYLLAAGSPRSRDRREVVAVDEVVRDAGMVRVLACRAARGSSRPSGAAPSTCDRRSRSARARRRSSPRRRPGYFFGSASIALSIVLACACPGRPCRSPCRTSLIAASQSRSRSLLAPIASPFSTKSSPRFRVAASNGPTSGLGRVLTANAPIRDRAVRIGLRNRREGLHRLRKVERMQHRERALELLLRRRRNTSS